VTLGRPWLPQRIVERRAIASCFHAEGASLGLDVKSNGRSLVDFTLLRAANFRKNCRCD